MHRADSLDEAKDKLNRAVGMLYNIQIKEFPNDIDLRQGIEITSNAMHWGSEMIRHGATRKDFEHCNACRWIGSMLKAKPPPFYKRVIDALSSLVA